MQDKGDIRVAGKRQPAAMTARKAGVFRLAPLFAGLLLLSGCAELQAWLPDIYGGEGKVAQPIPSTVIDEPAPPETAEPEAPATPPPATPSPEIRAAQTDLARLGYDPGKPDGYDGPMTRRAVEAYQRDAGIAPDGRITPELVAMLAAAPTPETAEPSAKPAFVVRNADIPPVYGMGDSYVWSTGQIETVARIVGDKLVWEVNNGVRFNADRNFIIPPSSWTGPSGSGEAVTQVDTRKSWPLNADAPLAFEVKENAATAKWRCEALEGEMISVPAGRFAAVMLACDRMPAPPGAWARRIWFYAPAVGHYVARTDVMADGTKISKYLMAIQPGSEDWPPAVRAGLDRAIQEALDNTAEGEEKLWTSTGVEEEFSIVPGPMIEKDGAVRCRNFQMTARSARGSRLYPAIYCSAGKGKMWQIPGDPGQAAGDLSQLTGNG